METKDSGIASKNVGSGKSHVCVRESAHKRCKLTSGLNDAERSGKMHDLDLKNDNQSKELRIGANKSESNGDELCVEDIVEGFAFSSFQSLEDLEVYVQSMLPPKESPADTGESCTSPIASLAGEDALTASTPWVSATLASPTAAEPPSPIPDMPPSHIPSNDPQSAVGEASPSNVTEDVLPAPSPVVSLPSPPPPQQQPTRSSTPCTEGSGATAMLPVTSVATPITPTTTTTVACSPSPASSRQPPHPAATTSSPGSPRGQRPSPKPSISAASPQLPISQHQWERSPSRSLYHSSVASSSPLPYMKPPAAGPAPLIPPSSPMALHSGLRTPTLMGPSPAPLLQTNPFAHHLSSSDLVRAQQELNARFLQDRERLPSLFRPDLLPAHTDLHKLAGGGGHRYPSPYDTGHPGSSSLASSHQHLGLGQVFPPLNTAAAAAPVPGLSPAATPLLPLGSRLQGAFQPKNLPLMSSAASPLHPAQLLSFADTSDKRPAQPSKKSGKWCSAHVKIAWLIHSRLQQSDPAAAAGLDRKLAAPATASPLPAANGIHQPQLATPQPPPPAAALLHRDMAAASAAKAAFDLRLGQPPQQQQPSAMGSIITPAPYGASPFHAQSTYSELPGLSANPFKRFTALGPFPTSGDLNITQPNVALDWLQRSHPSFSQQPLTLWKHGSDFHSRNGSPRRSPTKEAFYQMNGVAHSSAAAAAASATMSSSGEPARTRSRSPLISTSASSSLRPPHSSPVSVKKENHTIYPSESANLWTDNFLRNPSHSRTDLPPYHLTNSHVFKNILPEKPPVENGQSSLFGDPHAAAAAELARRSSISHSYSNLLSNPLNSGSDHRTPLPFLEKMHKLRFEGLHKTIASTHDFHRPRFDFPHSREATLQHHRDMLSHRSLYEGPERHIPMDTKHEASSAPRHIIDSADSTSLPFRGHNIFGSSPFINTSNGSSNPHLNSVVPKPNINASNLYNALDPIGSRLGQNKPVDSVATTSRATRDMYTDLPR